jgi:V8-like Glu-specific endopeptidase
MKLRKIYLTLVLSVSMLSAFASDKVIYGEDDRLDLFEVVDNLHLELAKSTAAMIEGSELTKVGENFQIAGQTLAGRGMCRTERFANQVTTAMCSGFLVAPDILVTAGHCVRTASDCARYKWVFDYGIHESTSTARSVPVSSVYSCKTVINTVLDRSSQDDFAVLKLDRAVTDRRPLEVRTEGKVADRTEIVVIGHPTGLPTKVADGAVVRDNSRPVYFVANLDTYGGNSGSAVFDSKTGVVEGILVRGENDYIYDYNQNCRASNYCTNEGCRGEDVTRITNIKDLMLAAKAGTL